MKRLFLIAALWLTLAASLTACGANETTQDALRIDAASLGA